MTHLDADALTVLALGEEPQHADHHLAGCDHCRGELTALRRVVAVGRAIDPAETIPDPPPHVWTGIAAELGIDRLSAAPPQAPARPRRPIAAALAAAACVAVLVVAVVLTRGPDVVAEAALDPVGGSGISGTASLVTDGDGLALRLHLDELPAGGGYHELWLLDDGGRRMVSLGPLTGAGPHRLPAGLEPGDFPVVDVSAEDFDGNPAHSGRSLSRGTLSG